MRTILIILILSTVSFAEKLKVVGTLPFFSELAKEIGGDLVDAVSVVHPKSDAHSIEPRPSDVLRVKNADLFLHSGLDYEPWRDPLVIAGGNPRMRSSGDKQFDMSVGISLLDVPTVVLTRAQGDIHIFGNVHYTLDPRNAVIMAKRLTEKLSAISKENSAVFEKNLELFLAKLQKIINNWEGKLTGDFISYHKDFNYLADFSGINIVNTLEPKPGIPPTAKHLEDLLKLKVVGLIQADYQPKSSSENFSKRTGIPLLLLCQNVGELPECETISSFYESNLTKLSSAHQNPKAP